MIAFEVSLNGKKACVAGVGEQGVVSASVCWVRRAAKRPASLSDEELFLDVGGLVSPTEEYVRWLDHRVIVEGDEVLIRVVKASRVSKAKIRRRENPKDRLRSQKRYVRQMAKQFGWKIVTR